MIRRLPHGASAGHPVLIRASKCGWVERRRLSFCHGPRGSIENVRVQSLRLPEKVLLTQHGRHLELGYTGSKSLPGHVIIAGGVSLPWTHTTPSRQQAMGQRTPPHASPRTPRTDAVMQARRLMTAPTRTPNGSRRLLAKKEALFGNMPNGARQHVRNAPGCACSRRPRSWARQQSARTYQGRRRSGITLSEIACTSHPL